MPSYRLGLDIGGTFTDFVLVESESGRVVLHKYLTSYPDSSFGVIAGLRELLALAHAEIGELSEIVHSTTLVTNAIIARRGAVTGLLTTQGFRHILDVGREQRYDAYDLFLEYPEPLIPLKLRREVQERTLADGFVLTHVDASAVQSAVSELVEQGIESLAVVLLHSYANPTNENAVAAAVRALYPDLPLSLSSQVAPLMGEWERTSTTVADGYVRPLVDGYLTHLQTQLAQMGFGGRFAIMLSTGGAAAPETARAFPIRLLESGPAAGALAGAAVGEQVGLRDLLAFDMGGTTAKACLIEAGQPHVGHGFEAARVNRFTRGSGLPIAVPSVALIEIGAGGGSIAWRDVLGLLQVGPQSAAADPGPACYALGGDQPTVTDANLLLGYLAPDFFLGGRMKLDQRLAATAIEKLAQSLSMDLISCSWGIHQVVNEQMAAAARMHIIERGHDPRRFTLVASGGAGPAHVASVARHLGARHYILPVGAGALASFGCLAAPAAFATERTLIAPLHQVEWARVSHLFAEMSREAQRRLAATGIDVGEIRMTYAVDMRMVGQIHHIQIALTLDELNEAAQGTIAERFHERYALLFARTNRAMALEFVNWRLVATGNPPALTPAHLPRSDHDDSRAALKGNRPAYFAGKGFLPTPVYDRYALMAGMVIVGPAILEERESTAVLPPGDCAVVDKHGNLLVEVFVVEVGA